jgi:hypothetical protein
MAILGNLAVIQIIFLPGFLLLQPFKLKKVGIFSTLIFSFGLSLLANYTGIFLLTALGLYTAPVIYAICALECILLIKVLWPAFSTPLQQAATDGLANLRSMVASWSIFLPDDEDRKRNPSRLIYLVLIVILLLLSVDAFIWLFKLLIYNYGEVFQTWDAIRSWNPWAVGWARNTFPDLSMLYPQLIPANWSLTYVFMGTSQVQFYAKWIMPLFTIFTLLILVDLGLEHKTLGFLVAAVIARYMIKKFLGDWITDGYVDIPLMFFAFLSVFPLIKAIYQTDPKIKLTYVFLGALFTAGAGVTKQGGLFMVIAYPILAYFLVIKDLKGYQPRIPLWAGYLLIILVLVTPWYLYKEVTFIKGVDITGIDYVTHEWYGNATLFERITNAAISLEKYLAVYIAAILAFPLLNKTYRLILLAIVIPYTFFWAGYVSYEVRTLSLVFPFVCLVAGMGIDRFIQITLDFLSRLHWERIKLYPLPIFIVAGLIFLGARLEAQTPNSVLIDTQVAQQKKLVLPRLNDRIYQALAAREPGAIILTNYPLIGYLPGLGEVSIYNPLNTYADYKNILSKNPRIRLVLYRQYGGVDFIDKFEADTKSGKQRFIFEDSQYTMVELTPAGN